MNDGKKVAKEATRDAETGSVQVKTWQERRQNGSNFERAMLDETTQPREQAGIDLDKLIAKLEVIAQVVDGENLPNTANVLRGIAADLTPQSTPEAQKAVAIVTGSSVQWLEGAGKLADRSPLYASPVAAPEASTLPDSRAMHIKDKVVDEPVDEHDRYFFRLGWNACRSAVASTGAAPEAPASEQQTGEPTCAMCNDSGIVGYPPDQYEECPDCIKARAATTASASGWQVKLVIRGGLEVRGESFFDCAALGDGTHYLSVGAALTQQSAAQAPSPDIEQLANRVRDLIADHVADNWPMVRHPLEEIEKKLRAINAGHLLKKADAAMSAATEQGEKKNG